MASYTYELIELGDDAHGLGCKCCRLSNGLDLPSPKKDLSKAEIRRLAVGFASSVLKDWTKLNGILKRFEGTIQKRWLKKGLKQRRDILLKACPEMPTCHRPDFAGFRKTLKTAPRSRTCPSRAFLWPYINLEDLQQSHPMLLFLHSRGRHLPENFISSDIDAAHLGKGWDFGQDASPTSDSMVFYDQRTPRTYGDIMGLCKGLSMAPTHYSFAMKLVSRVHPNLGLLGLEIQAEIYSFLVEYTMLILHDVHPSQYVLAAHQPAPGPLEQRRSEWVTLQDHMLEAPYRLPQGLDLDRIKAMVSARRSSAVDHIWMLREDPSYFIETLKEWKEHDHRSLKCTCGDCWRLAAADMLIDAFSYFLFWHDINRRFKQMPSIETQLKNADLEQVRLPMKEERLWASLDEIMGMMILAPLKRITDGLPVSPRMRHCYPNLGDSTADSKARWIFKAVRSEAERRVDIVFNAISDCEQRALHQMTPLVQEAQYMLDTEPAAAQLVDSWILGQFSDLALLAELNERMDRFKPWSDAWRACSISSRPILEDVGKLLRLDTSLIEAINHACEHCTTLYDPAGHWWRYPADKRPSKANVDQMRHAEAHLDMFWAELEENVLDFSGEDLLEVLNARGLRKRKLHRTPIWKERIVISQATATYQPLRELDSNAPRFGERCNDAKSTPRTKIKTRGAPSTSSIETVATPEPTEPAPAVQQIVKINKRTYKVFSALIPHPTAENHQRTEIAWDDLLHAMNAIGMQPEKLYGSVWSFCPTEECMVDVTRGIQFHEPKEVRRGNKIGSHMVRAFGRRLKHAFGWEAGMFVCE